MFVNAVPDNKGKKDGYYCTLVESFRDRGISKHRILLTFGFVATPRIPYLKAAFNKGNPAEILQKELRSLENKNKEEKHMSDNTNKKTTITCTFKITEPDGTVIERKVERLADIPLSKDFDLSTKKGFLSDFDSLEQAVLGVRNEIGEAITQGYMDTASKKKRTKKKG